MSLLVHKWIRSNRIILLPDFPTLSGPVKVENITFPSNNTGVIFNYIIHEISKDETCWSISEQIILEIFTIERTIIHSALAFLGLSNEQKNSFDEEDAFPDKHEDYFCYQTDKIKQIIRWFEKLSLIHI